MCSNNKEHFLRNIQFTICVMMILAMSGWVSCQQDAPESKLEAYYYRKCQQVSGDGHGKFEKLRGDAYELSKYFDSVFKDLPGSKSHFCKVERKNLDVRIDVLSDDLKACLPQQEMFLATFLRESFKEFLHFLCHNNGENLDTFFGYDGTSCRSKIQKSMNTTDIDNCFSRIFAPLSGKVTQKEICDDMDVAKKCFSSSLSYYCTENRKFRELNEVFFGYISKPCSACYVYLNLTVLLLCAVVTFFWK